MVERKVLLVEDDPVLQRAIVRAARGVAGVVVAGTGAEGLALAAAGPPPCVVLLDYALPDTDGVQVLRKLRAQAPMAQVPIILFSSLRDPRRKAEALAAGATDWIAKPDEPAALRRVVAELCAKYARQAPSPRRAAAPSAT